MVAEQTKSNKLVEQLSDKILQLRDTCNEKIKAKNYTIKQLTSQIKHNKKTQKMYENNVNLLASSIDPNQLDALQSTILHALSQSSNQSNVQFHLQSLQQYIQQQFDSFYSSAVNRSQLENTIQTQTQYIDTLEKRLAEQQQLQDHANQQLNHKYINDLTQKQLHNDELIAELKEQIRGRDVIIDELRISQSSYVDTVNDTNDHLNELNKKLAEQQLIHTNHINQLMDQHRVELSTLQQQHDNVLAQQANDYASAQQLIPLRVPISDVLHAATTPTTESLPSTIPNYLQHLRTVLQSHTDTVHHHPLYDYLKSRYYYTISECTTNESLIQNEINQCTTVELSSMMQYIEQNQLSALYDDKCNELNHYTHLYFKSDVNRVLHSSRSQPTTEHPPNTTDIHNNQRSTHIKPASNLPSSLAKSSVHDITIINNPVHSATDSNLHTRTLSKPLPAIKQSQSTTTDTTQSLSVSVQATETVALGSTFIAHINDDFSPHNIDTLNTPIHTHTTDEFECTRDDLIAPSNTPPAPPTIAGDSDLQFGNSQLILPPVINHASTIPSADVDQLGRTEEIKLLCKLCDECVAVLYCNECSINLCSENNCDAELHSTNDMRHHHRNIIQQQNHNTTSPIATNHPPSTSNDELPDMSTPQSIVSTQRDALAALRFIPQSHEQHHAILQQHKSKQPISAVLPTVHKPTPITTRRRQENLPVFLQTTTLTG